ncbi:MAG: hypothetical protein E6Q95_02565 [Chitinophagaceae bacterium]|nr:MAG: hypothetical protein E6Q95_02565 [Chitinophagaceae bacterium]
MNCKTLTYIITILSLGFLTSCNLLDKKPKEKIIREEKPVTKVDITIDTANAFNSFFYQEDSLNALLANPNLGDTLSNRIKSFYNSRNSQFAWFSAEGVPEHTRSFWNLIKNYLNYSKDSSIYDKAFFNKMDIIVNSDSIKVRNNRNYQRTDFNLTRLLYIYADHAYAYDPDFTFKSLEWYIPKKRYNLKEMSELVELKKNQYADEYAPVNNQYQKLRDKFIRYKKIADHGGWQPVNSSVDIIKKGFKGKEVIELQKRLKAEGFLDLEDSVMTNTYDSVVANAVNKAKEIYGYKQDGTAGQTFLRDLNAPIEERLQQILINMERMRWLPLETQTKGRSIMVNIPEFMLHIYEDGKPAWNMVVVVGKEGSKTTVFTGNLKTIVFSPYWNVPTSIVKAEMGGNPSNAYLARKHMEKVNGRIRQKPGPWNSLGLVKFLFPNSFNIYFHDSPSKSLFERDKRYFSHGCIRLKEPKKFASYLLNDTIKWSDKKIDSAMHSGKEKFVSLKKAIPVLITYFTSWVDDNEMIEFREDIYGRDEIVAKKMFLNSTQTSRAATKPVKIIPKKKVKDSTAVAKPIIKKEGSDSSKKDSTKNIHQPKTSIKKDSTSVRNEKMGN